MPNTTLFLSLNDCKIILFCFMHETGLLLRHTHNYICTHVYACNFIRMCYKFKRVYIMKLTVILMCVHRPRVTRECYGKSWLVVWLEGVWLGCIIAPEYSWHLTLVTAFPWKHSTQMTQILLFTLYTRYIASCVFVTITTLLCAGFYLGGEKWHLPPYI